MLLSLALMFLSLPSSPYLSQSSEKTIFSKDLKTKQNKTKPPQNCNLSLGSKALELGVIILLHDTSCFYFYYYSESVPYTMSDIKEMQLMVFKKYQKNFS